MHMYETQLVQFGTENKNSKNSYYKKYIDEMIKIFEHKFVLYNNAVFQYFAKIFISERYSSYWTFKICYIACDYTIVI